MISADDGARALQAARRAHDALAHGQTKDAAWLALYALEVDNRCGLAWSVVSRILIEVSQDPLGTIAARHALELGVPDDTRPHIERHHRIDLWTRGLIMAEGGASILRASEFDDASKLKDTPEKNAWFEDRTRELGGIAAAVLAAKRMIAAFADAWIVPDSGTENPLRTAGAWEETEIYRAWKAKDPLGAVPGLGSTGGNGVSKGNGAMPGDIVVLSDHWIEREIAELAAHGEATAAEERAKVWVQLRAEKLRPKAMLVRVLAAAEKTEERDAIATEIVMLADVTQDLNELEEARVALGELELWEAQIRVLDRMEQIAPGHPVILANRGVALIELGDHEQGKRELERALQVDPDNGPALANLGLEKMREDDYVAARKLLEHAVEIAPDQPLARLYLAACKNNQGDRPGAIADLEQVLVIDPENKQARQLLHDLKAHIAKKN